MFQRMRSLIAVDVDGVDLTTVTDIEVQLIQESTGVEMLLSGSDIVVMSETQIAFGIPKDVAMQLEVEPIRGQIMFTRDTGLPDATKPFTIPVSELIKEAGYGN